MPKTFSSEAIKILPLDKISVAIPEMASQIWELDEQAYKHWLQDVFHEHDEIGKDIFNKKKIELFCTYTLLDIPNVTSYVDAAGGKYSYANKISNQTVVLQDRIIDADLREKCSKNVKIVERCVSELRAEDESIDAISCHHSFEHFQENIDISFVKEIQRVLRLNGKAAIIPFFFSEQGAELSNDHYFANWSDKSALHIYDSLETLPGKKRSGHYARLYSIQMFRERLLKIIDLKRFSVSLLEIRHRNGKPIPDMSLKDHIKRSWLNIPYRVLLIQRIHSSFSR